MDKATSVKVGLAPPPVAKQDDPAMNKLCIPWLEIYHIIFWLSMKTFKDYSILTNRNI